MSDDLSTVRTKIDALDNKIHDLLMERAELIKDVSAIKRKHNKPIVHPAREAMMMRRLLSRHSGILPQAAVIGIWRELVGGVSMLQRGLHAYVSTESHGSDQAQQYSWDMAKDYCGSIIPMERMTKSSDALACTEHEMDSLAVLPWPQDNDEWWLKLAQQPTSDLPPMSVIAALPFGTQEPYENVHRKSLVISRMDYQRSGDDNSFIVVQAGEENGLDTFERKIHEQEFLYKKIAQTKIHGSVNGLYEVSGYIDNDDDKMTSLNNDLGGIANCTVIGGFPVPPQLRDGDTSPVRL